MERGNPVEVLVSGAGGFIGRSLVAALRSDGAQVHRIVRGKPETGEVGIDIASRTVDLSQLPGGSLDAIDVIFHLAGEPITPVRWSPEKKQRIRSSRIVSTDLLARALARASGARKVFVCASAIGIYGDRGDEILDERSPAGTGFLAEVCRAWETASAPARDVGHRVVNVRSGVVLGKGGGALRAQVPLFRAGLGGRLGDGTQWTSWISLSDEVAALLHVARSESVSGACNLTSPNPRRNAEYTKILGRVLHRPTVIPVPKPFLDFVAGKQAGASVLLASQRVLPQALERSGYVFSDRDLEQTLIAAAAS